MIRVVERRVGSGPARAGVMCGPGDQRVKRRLVRLEPPRLGAEAQNFHLHGVALLDVGQHVHPAHDVPEDGVLIIEPHLWAEHEAVLRAIGIRAVVGHFHHACGIMPQARHDSSGKE